jgi:hypothetical protein
MMFGFQTQITLLAPAWTNRLWMCRQAATNSDAEVWPVPHGYQLPFISWPKLIATGRLSLRTASANLVMYPSLWPLAIAAAVVS